jgi:HKD family nuclease
MFTSEETSFHPKGWLFYSRFGRHTTIIESSNMSSAVFVSGVEWNVRVQIDCHGQGAELIRKFAETINRYWNQKDDRF